MLPAEVAIAEDVARTVRPLVQSRVPRPTTCVLSSRIALEVLTYFEVEAWPQPCQVMAMNEPMVRWLESGQAGGEEAAQAAGAYAVQTHVSAEEPGQWGGHLILRMQDAMLDSDMGALSRPNRGIHLPDGFVGGTGVSDPWPYVIGGATVIYTLTDDQTWEESGDWTSKNIKAYAGPIIRAIKRRLSA